VNVGHKVIVFWSDILERGAKSYRLVGHITHLAGQDVTALFKRRLTRRTRDPKPATECEIQFPPWDTVFVRRALALDYLTTPAGHNPVTSIILGTGNAGPVGMVPAIGNASSLLGIGQLTLTPTQDRAINHALSQDLALIQGPPGCGKTTVISALCVELLRNHDETPGRILVCGTSNVSVENLVRAIHPALNGIGRSLAWLASRARDVKDSSDLDAHHEFLVS
jgi:hypothetical protein